MSSQVDFGRYFTEAEERQILNTVKRVDHILAKRDYYWMELLRSTSIRVSALSGLTLWDAQLALKEGRLKLRKELVKGRKGEHDLPLNRRSTKALRELIKINKRMRGNWDVDFVEIPLVLSLKRKNLSVRSIQDRMQYWLKEAGLTEGTVHWWRHTWAKRAIKNSTNPSKAILSVQRVLGHSQIKTTTIYLRPDKDDIAEIMRDSE